MENLKNKYIILLSPVKWGKMRVSKHHYALELAQSGNIVYYLEPPEINLKKGFEIIRSTENRNLFIVTYRSFARGRRFLPKCVFKILEWYQSKWLLKKLKFTPDVLFSFDLYRFSNLKWFNAKIAIFFAADLYKSDIVPGEAVSADLCIGVSSTIVELLQRTNRNSYFINHGLNSVYVKMAIQQQNESHVQRNFEQITVGYIGNLLIGSLDRKTITEVIRSNSDVNFVFWGHYKLGLDIAMQSDAIDLSEFILFLEKSPNVVLAGPKDQYELSKEILIANVFWLCYDSSYTWAVDASNSHKILEYLATGRPVISTNISHYVGKNMLYMPDSKSNISFPEFFKKTLGMLKEYENPHRFETRIQFALDNSYFNKIYEIDKLIGEYNKKNK